MTTPSRPLVTLAVPTFNRASQLELLLHDIHAQTYPNLEILVSNNASTDKTHQVLQRWLKREPRLRTQEQEQTVPGITNFNSLLKNAKGQYFGWLSDDDRITPEYVASLLHIFKQYPKTVLASPAFQVEDQHGQLQLHKQSFADWPDSTPLTLESILREPFDGYKANLFYGLYRTAVLHKIGGYNSSSALAASDLLTVHAMTTQGELRRTSQVTFRKQEIFSLAPPPKHQHLSRLRPLVPSVRRVQHLIQLHAAKFFLDQVKIYWQQNNQLIQQLSVSRQPKLKMLNLWSTWQLLWTLLPHDMSYLQTRHTRFSG